MKLLSVKGPLAGEEFEFIPVVETTWETWKELYPDTQVVSTQTGYQRSYGRYPYGSYMTSSDLIFPVSNLDGRFHRKERMHGILAGDMATALSVESLPEEITTLNHTLNTTDIVTVGSSEKNFAVSFERLLDGKVLEFAAVQDNQPVIMIDVETGSGWDAFGRCIEGPYMGKQLKPVVSFIAYWFSWAAFFPETEIMDI